MIPVAARRLPSVMPIDGPARSKRTVVVVEVAAGSATTVDAVDTLARLQLAARRVGLELRIVPAGAPLRGLIRLVGLEEALGVEPAELAVEGGGETEPLEQGGVEEVMDVGDTTA